MIPHDIKRRLYSDPKEATHPLLGLGAVYEVVASLAPELAATVHHASRCVPALATARTDDLVLARDRCRLPRLQITCFRRHCFLSAGDPAAELVLVGVPAG